MKSRRWVLGAGATGAVAAAAFSRFAKSGNDNGEQARARKELGPYMTRQDDFEDVSRGNPPPHALSKKRLAEVGLSRETWQLDVDSDPEHPAEIRNPMTRKSGTAIDFKMLMKLAEQHAVRFPKVMTCLNMGRPLGMGIWEGVPLRNILWLADPQRDLRRVFYYGYHNDKPAEMFRSSLPVGRILEDAFDLPPVILCYKLNGEWLSPERGGPVRVVVPEAYGFKSVKWLSNIVLTNLASANDTYENANNDIDTHLKSFAKFVNLPKKVKANEPFLIQGYAQTGVSGVSQVQVWSHNQADGKLPLNGRFIDAPWQNAKLLPHPKHWGTALSAGKIPADTLGFDQSGAPTQWPMRLAKVNWMYLHPGLVAGKHILRCRTIDDNEQAQPMPRPFRKSGYAKIELRHVVAG